MRHVLLVLTAMLAVACSEDQERRTIVTNSGPGQVNICERPAELGCTPVTTPPPVILNPVFQPTAQMARHNLMADE